MARPKACCLLRDEPKFRRECFTEGLRAAGFDVVERIKHPAPEDAVLLWNRRSSQDAEAKRFRNVLVAENAYLRLKGWYALALDHHNGPGRFPVGGPERWAALGIELQPWRTGTEVVILGQRSIGEKGIASPKGWEESIQRKVRGRIRRHPGKRDAAVPLEEDLADARAVVTWGSAAALQALVMGIPCFYGLPAWIGARSSRPVGELDKGPLRDDAARLEMFRRLAWAMSPIHEIRSGESICRLIEHSRSGTNQKGA